MPFTKGHKINAGRRPTNAFSVGHKRSADSIFRQSETMKKQYASGERKTPIAALNTPEANAKKSHKGSKHPKWIEDRSLLKGRPRFEGRDWRNKIFARDNFTCQLCFKRGGRLQADHIKPYVLFPKLRWVLDNGRTLCETCHKKTPTYGAKAKNYVSIS